MSKKRQIMLVETTEECKVAPLKIKFRRTADPIVKFTVKPIITETALISSAPANPRRSKSLQSYGSSEDEEFIIPNFSQQPSELLSLISQPSLPKPLISSQLSRNLRFNQQQITVSRPRIKNSQSSTRMTSALGNVMQQKRAKV